MRSTEEFSQKFFTERLHLAYTYVDKWHAGMSVPVDVPVVDYLKGISDTVRHHCGDQEAVIAACLYKGVIPNTSHVVLLNPQTIAAPDGSNTMDNITYFFGRCVGRIVLELNDEPKRDAGDALRWQNVGEWAHYCLGRQAQLVLLAEKEQNLKNRMHKEIQDVETAQRQAFYCISRLKVIDAIQPACPKLAKSARQAGQELLDKANAYLRANGQYRGRD